MKVLVNKCYGSFGVSDKFVEYWCEKHPELNSKNIISLMFDDNRTDPEVIALVEYLGEEANDRYSKLVVVDMPDNVTDWTIDQYDGWERLVYVVDGKLNYA